MFLLIYLLLMSYKNAQMLELVADMELARQVGLAPATKAMPLLIAAPVIRTTTRTAECAIVCSLFILIVANFPKECTNADTCSGHGTCKTDGSCNCDQGYAGSNCSSCDAYYFNSGGSCQCTNIFYLFVAHSSLKYAQNRILAAETELARPTALVAATKAISTQIAALVTPTTTAQDLLVNV